MEGISKTEGVEGKVMKDTERIWKAGVYARLSVDHHDWKNESIDTQIEIAKKYISQTENVVFIRSYVDLGKTGTNYDRPGFDELMTDIRRREINCVIVKDFSRFGRSYIETGNYIERIFPFFNIRFISVADDYDSCRTREENALVDMNLRNIVNELYARDCSDKVRAVKRAKLKQGCYVGGPPSYGYTVKEIDGKRVLVPEEETSAVVRIIYELFDQGNGIKKIISYLYEQRIHRPSDYRKTGCVRCKEGKTLKQWSDQTIRSILSNHVYIGTLLMQVRAEGGTYRGGKSCCEPDEIVIMEHTHESIIEEDKFYRVSSRIEGRRKKELQKIGQLDGALAEDLYKGLIYCGECGGRLNRTCTSSIRSYKTSVKTYSYGCPGIQRIDYLKCDSHFISGSMLNKILLEILWREFDLSGICINELVNYNRMQTGRRQKEEEKINKVIMARVQNTDIRLSSMYMQYKSGRIDQQIFLNLKAGMETQKDNFIKELTEQELKMQDIQKKEDEINDRICCLFGEKDDIGIDGQMVRCLVKRITVYKDKRVEIIFNFKKGQLERNEGRSAENE